MPLLERHGFGARVQGFFSLVVAGLRTPLNFSGLNVSLSGVFFPSTLWSAVAAMSSKVMLVSPRDIEDGETGLAYGRDDAAAQIGDMNKAPGSLEAAHGERLPLADLIRQTFHRGRILDPGAVNDPKTKLRDFRNAVKTQDALASKIAESIGRFDTGGIDDGFLGLNLVVCDVAVNPFRGGEEKLRGDFSEDWPRATLRVPLILISRAGQ